MKRFLVCFVVALFLLSSANAEGIDISQMSVDELQTLQTSIAKELSIRSTNPNEHPDVLTLHPAEKLYLINDGEFVLYFTGSVKDHSSYQYCDFQFAFENYSDISTGAWAEDDKLNGWNRSGLLLCGTIGSGEKKASMVGLTYNMALIEKANDIEEYVFHLVIADENYKPYKDYGTFILHFDPLLWEK